MPNSPMFQPPMPPISSAAGKFRQCQIRWFWADLEIGAASLCGRREYDEFGPAIGTFKALAVPALDIDAFRVLVEFPAVPRGLVDPVLMLVGHQIGVIFGRPVVDVDIDERLARYGRAFRRFRRRGGGRGQDQQRDGGRAHRALPSIPNWPIAHVLRKPPGYCPPIR